MNVKRAPLGAVLSLMFASACTVVGTDYKAPQADVPSSWEQRANVREAAAESLATWWTALNDETLNGLIQKAIAQNLSVVEAMHRIQVVRASRGVAVSQLGPLITGDGGYSRNYLGTRAFGFAPQGDRTYELFTAQLNASWELDLFGRIHRSIEAADADIGASVEDYRSVLVAVVAEVARQYVGLRSAELRLAIAKENVKNQEETLELTEARERGGLVPELDVLRARTNLETTRAEIPLLEQARVSALNELRVLLGEHGEGLDIASVGALPQSPKELAVRTPLATIRTRPDVRRSERSLAAETARIGIAEGDFYPRLFLDGSFGLTSTDISDFDSRAVVAGFGPSMSWNLFSSGAISSQVAAQKARTRAAHAAWSGAVVRALADVEVALSGVTKQRRRTASLQIAADNALASRAQSQRLYRGGLTDFNTVVAADQTRLAAEDNLAVSQTRELEQVIALYLAMGGGWRDQPLAGEGGHESLLSR